MAALFFGKRMRLLFTAIAEAHMLKPFWHSVAQIRSMFCVWRTSPTPVHILLSAALSCFITSAMKTVSETHFLVRLELAICSAIKGAQ